MKSCCTRYSFSFSTKYILYFVKIYIFFKSVTHFLDKFFFIVIKFKKVKIHFISFLYIKSQMYET